MEYDRLEFVDAIEELAQRAGMQVPREAASIDSVMTRFALEGIPVIHLIKINVLAERYGLPLQPQVIPAVGEGCPGGPRCLSSGN